MVIDRKIERYVKEVVQYIPSRLRAEAEAEITEMLTDMVRDHAGGKEPDILDAREVLDELGDPGIMAMSWMETRQDLEEESFLDNPAAKIMGLFISADNESVEKMNRILRLMLMIFSVLAVFFVGFGIIALGTHLIKTMLPIFLGCVLGLLAIAGRSVLVRQS